MSSAQRSDGELVAEVLAGRQHVFQELVQRYQRVLFHVARSRLGSPEGAEDVVQETFLCAFRFLRSYDSKYSFRTWLWTILLNQCNRDYHRRNRTIEQNAVGLANSDVESVDSQPSPISALLAKEQSRQLDAHLSTLPTLRADALRLRFFGGLKFHEIADAMGCSLSTAKNRVRWGLEEVAQLIAASESTPPTSETDLHSAGDSR